METVELRELLLRVSRERLSETNGLPWLCQPIAGYRLCVIALLTVRALPAGNER